MISKSNKVKKILFLIDSLYVAGAQRRCVNLAKALSKKYSVEILYYQDNYKQRAQVDHSNLSVSVSRLSQNLILRLFFIFKISFAIRRKKPDVIISFLDIPNILSKFYKFFFRKTKVINCFPSDKFYHREKLSLFFEKNFHFLADYRVANSKMMIEYLKKNKINTKNVVFIPNGVDDVFFKDHQSSSSNINYNITNYVVVSRYVELKGYELLIEALTKIPEDLLARVKINCYGSVSDLDYFNKLNKSIKSLNLEKHITLNPIAEDIVSILKKNQWMIHPSYHEGMSNAVLESMAMGLPPILSDHESNLEIADHDKNSLVYKNKNSTALAGTIIRSIQMKPEKTSQMGQNASAKIFKLYNLEKMASNFEKLF